MGRLLFSPFTEEGFLYPAIGLGQHLVARGHLVAMIAEEAGRSLLEGRGILCFPASSAEAISCRVGTWGDQESIACHSGMLKRAIQAFQPDVLVISALNLSGLIAREETNIPTVVLGFASYMYPRAMGEIHKDSDAVERLRWWRYSETVRILEAARARAGLMPSIDDWRCTALLGDLFLLRTIPALEDSGVGLPSRVRFAGACLWEPEGSESQLGTLIDWRKRSGPPVIYVQVGRSFKGASLWPIITEAFAREGVTIVASLSRCDVPIGDVPENFLLLPCVNQSVVLSQARAVICDGHSTAVLGALCKGVPCVLAPNGSGTEEIAFRCQRAGVAEVLTRTAISGAAVRTATLATLGDGALELACSKVRQGFAAFRNFDKAGAEVEKVLLNC